MIRLTSFAIPLYLGLLLLLILPSVSPTTQTTIDDTIITPTLLSSASALSSSVSVTTSNVHFPSTEYAALYDLSVSTNGSYWHYHNPYSTFGYPWNFDGYPDLLENPCDPSHPWQGIQCNSTCIDEPCTMVSLSLNAMNLAGTIPASIQSFSALTNLSLSHNQLTGAIPSSIGQLGQLRYLDGSNNYIQSSIPDTFWNMSLLQSVFLAHNRITGSLSSHISQLRSLQSLDLSYNYLSGNLSSFATAWPLLSSSLQILLLPNNGLTGSIPSTINQLSQLQVLELQYNTMRGKLPESIGQLQSLRVLQLQNNAFSGVLPTNLTLLTSLNQLVLTQNAFSGPLPTDLGKLQALTDLDFENNDFQGDIPVSIGRCNLLRHLYLNGNALHGTIPATIGNLSLLKNLQLNDNALYGPIPEEIGENCRLLFSLYLNVNALSGTIPTSLGKLFNLRILRLDKNQLHGSIPSSLQHLHLLKILQLYANQLNGSIPENVFSNATTPLLYNIDVSSNQLTGTLPVSLTSLRILQYLSVDYNFFSGSIPTQYGASMPLVQVLYMNNNLLNGSIPETFQFLSSLQFLQLSYNQLTGSVPSLVSSPSLYAILVSNNNFNALSSDFYNTSANNSTKKLAGLQIFDVSENDISGQIPTNLGVIYPGLLSLYLSNNALSGSLPLSLTYMTSLVNFFVSNNQLTGSLPDTFFTYSHFPNVAVLSLSGNCFVGTLPQSLCSLQKLENLLLDGLHASTACSTRFFSDQLFVLKNTGVLLSNNPERRMSGSIPSCLLVDLYATLTIVHVGGNGLTGTLPAVGIGGSGSYDSSSYGSSSFIDNNSKMYSGHVSEKSNEIYNSYHTSNNQMTNLGAAELAIEDDTEVQLPYSVLTEVILSGNQLTGTIPALFWQNTNLTSLDLSFNRLQGTIPSSISLPITSNALSISLQVNQLSGTIPSSLINVDTINILEGNMFGCDGNWQYSSNMYHRQLPVNDPLYATYHCGSNNTNTILVVFFCCVVVVWWIYQWLLPGIMQVPLRHWLLCYFNHNNNSSFIRHTMNRFSSSFSHSRNTNTNTTSIISVGKDSIVSIDDSSNSISSDTSDLFLYQMESLVSLLVVYLSIIAIVLYVSLSVYYPTYQVQYIWNVSGLYVKGVVPATLMCMVWISVAGIVIGFLPKSYQILTNTLAGTLYLGSIVMQYMQLLRRSGTNTNDGDHKNQSNDSHNSINNDSSSASSTTINNSDQNKTSKNNKTTARNTIWTMHTLSSSIAVFCNLCFVSLINGLYVYAVQANISTYALVLLSLLLSMFKLGWQYLLVNGRWMVIFGVQKHETYLSDTAIIGLSLFNNIIAPLLAEIFLSPNCFQYLLHAAPALPFSYSLQSSIVVANVLSNTTTVFTVNGDSDVLNPFQYSYQCSSTLIANYGYVFVLRYLLSGVVEPLCIWIWVMRKSFVSLLKKSNSNNSNATKSSSSSFWKVGEDTVVTYIAMGIPLLWKLQVWDSGYLSFNDEQVVVPSKAENNEEDNHKFLLELSSDLKSFDDSIASVEKGLGEPHKVRQRWITRFVTDIAMLVTFGVLFPPLAIVIALSVFKETYDTRVTLGRLMDVSNRLLLDINRLVSPKYQPQQSNNAEGLAVSLLISWRTRLKTIQTTVYSQLQQAIAMIWFGIFGSVCVAVCIWVFVLFDTLMAASGEYSQPKKQSMLQGILILLILMLVLSPYVWEYLLKENAVVAKITFSNIFSCPCFVIPPSCRPCLSTYFRPLYLFGVWFCSALWSDLRSIYFSCKRRCYTRNEGQSDRNKDDTNDDVEEGTFQNTAMSGTGSSVRMSVLSTVCSENETRENGGEVFALSSTNRVSSLSNKEITNNPLHV